jgi:drug/metabolite transporter (DMT)-like permease
MPVTVLYVVVVLIWGTTWIAIPFQLGEVAEELSVAYRFGLASLFLFAYATLSKRKIGIPRQHYPMVVLMGALLFSVNYLFVYYGAGYLTSGLVAVLFSLIIVFNALLERLFFGTPFAPRLQVASVIGFLGISLVFWPEVANFGFSDRTTIGVVWILLAIVVAALANMTAIVTTSTGVSLVVLNAHAMGWGALTSFATAAVLGRPFAFSFSPDYLWSLLYLAIFGSSIAFGCYLALLKRIGAARAAYSSLLFPIVALLMSTIFESYQWTVTALAGVILSLIGNWLALSNTPEKSDSPG